MVNRSALGSLSDTAGWFLFFFSPVCVGAFFYWGLLLRGALLVGGCFPVLFGVFFPFLVFFFFFFFFRGRGGVLGEGGGVVFPPADGKVTDVSTVMVNSKPVQ